MSLLEPTSTNLSRDVALVAELLAVPTDERYAAVDGQPAAEAQDDSHGASRSTRWRGRTTPVLIVSRTSTGSIRHRWICSIGPLRASPICQYCCFVTLRPDFQPTWVGLPHVTTLPLSRLGRRDSAGVIGGITRGKALPDAVVEQILSHSDGVALFLEELTRMLLESGPLRETAESYVLDGSLPPLAVPTTLQALLVARLDRLGSGKDVALVGAAIGREFSHELIAATSGMAPRDLDGALERLTASGLISRRGTPPLATYAFEHALVQDTAYATMLKSQRRQLHASIRQGVGRAIPGTGAEPAWGRRSAFWRGWVYWSEAIGYWRRAARLQARGRPCAKPSELLFERALTFLETLRETHERQQQAIDLRCDLSQCLLSCTRDSSSSRFLRAAARLAEALDDRLSQRLHGWSSAGGARVRRGGGRPCQSGWTMFRSM